MHAFTPLPTSPIQQLLNLATLTAPPVQTGTQLYALMRDHTRLLPSGCPRCVCMHITCAHTHNSLDTLLRGGLREGHLIEVFGESGSGKTQLCLTATCEMLRRGERVLYVDTSNAVHVQRLETMLAAGPQTSQQPLDGLHVARVHDVFALLQLLDACVTACEASECSQVPAHCCLANNLSVVKVPCTPHATATQAMQPAHHRQPGLVAVGVARWRIWWCWCDYCRPRACSRAHTGHALLVATAQHLRALAERYSIAVLVTNAQVGSTSAEGPRPGLGDAWRNQPHVRLRMAVQGEARLVELLRCTVGRPGEAVAVRLGASGLLAA